MNKNIGVISTVLIILALFILASAPLNLSLDTDAIVITRPNDGTYYDSGQTVFIEVTFDPQKTSVTTDAMCVGYEIILKNQRTGYIIDVDSRSGEWRTSFLVSTSSSTDVVGNYSLIASFSIASVSLGTGDANQKEIGLVLKTAIDSTTFYNEITIQVGDVAPESSDVNSEPVLTSSDPPDGVYGFSVIMLMSLPIIIYWRRRDED